jgi:hypothetical protein
MNDRELLAPFDRAMRAGIQIGGPGFRVDRAPGYVRIVGVRGYLRRSPKGQGKTAARP